MTSLAGSFLVAKPVLQDPNFIQTVVLILRHNAEGAFGLVVNRPTEAEGVPFPVFVGGPCPASGLIMLHGHAEWASPEEEGTPEVVPGVYIGDAECLQRVSEMDENEKPARYRVFAGYSGWGPDQLERELSSGAWIITPATAALIFDVPNDDVWDQLSPPALPRPSDN
jgi:putative transcriptional regulator